jgi:hypothetical protein
MKKMSAFVVVLAAFALLLTACSGAPSVGITGERDVFAAEEPQLSIAPEAAADFAESGAGGFSAPSPSAERLVIQNASLSIVVDDPERSMASISDLAEEFGGFVTSSYLYQTTLGNGLQVPSANITIRVPAERLQEALDRIQSGANDVLTTNRSGQDVTAEYTDLQSRLRNLEDAEVLLRQIMEQATDAEDILTAFNQLNSITEQIEVLKGQIQYYEESAAMSAISVELIASQAVQPITIAGWEPVGVAKDAIQSLINALQGIVNALIWLVLYLLPIVLVIGIPLWLVVRFVRGRLAQRSRKSASKRK